MSAVRLIPVLLALLTADLVAQGKKLSKDSAFTCVMHPEVSMERKGACPKCGMRLVVAAAPTPKKVQIPPGGLRAYCVNYLKTAIENRKDNDGAAYGLVAAHSALKAKGWRKNLRVLLEEGKPAWLVAAAVALGKCHDRESAPALKKLLSDKRFTISPSYCCENHPEETARNPGKCSRCGKPFLVKIPNLWRRVQIAGALHEMGDEEGFQVLEELASGPYGYIPLSAMSLRDSPGVRASLAAGARAKDEHRRSSAVLAQLRLGLEVGLQESLRILVDKEQRGRADVIYAMGASGLKSAIEPLKKIVRDDDSSRSEKVSAAQALVKLGERKYLGLLKDYYHKAEGTDDRISMCVALGEVGDTSVLPLIETAIENHGAYRHITVGAAAKVLGRGAAKAKKK